MQSPCGRTFGAAAPFRSDREASLWDLNRQSCCRTCNTLQHEIALPAERSFAGEVVPLPGSEDVRWHVRTFQSRTAFRPIPVGRSNMSTCQRPNARTFARSNNLAIATAAQISSTASTGGGLRLRLRLRLRTGLDNGLLPRPATFPPCWGLGQPAAERPADSRLRRAGEATAGSLQRADAPARRLLHDRHRRVDQQHSVHRQPIARHGSGEDVEHAVADCAEYMA